MQQKLAILVGSLMCGMFSFPAASGNTKNSEDLALRLTVLVAYVQEKCPSLSINMAMVRSTIDAMGVDIADLQTAPRMRQATIIMRGFQESGNTVCEVADEMFGPNGNTVPGVFQAK